MAGLHDMAKMSVSGPPGTGTIPLAAAVAGFQSFAAAGVIDQEVISYSIQDGSNWEVGRGTYTASSTTLTRGSLYSSNSNNPINATTGATVWIAFLAEDLIGRPTINLSASGLTQGSGTVIAAKYNAFTTVTSSSNAITLPQPIPGDFPTFIWNGGTFDIATFPASGHQINTQGSNIAMPLMAGTLGIFAPMTITQWYAK